MVTSRLTVSVDPHMCEAHALCTEIAPEIFNLPDDGDIATCDENPSEALLPKVRAAVDACPRQAISVATQQS